MAKLLLESLLSSESDSDEVEDLLVIASLLHEKKLPKSNYLKKRKTHGEFILKNGFSNEKFKNYYSVTREQFSELHDFIKESIDSEYNASSIGSEEKLAVFLRYLASGNSFKSIAYSYRMSDRTVSNIVKEVAEAIWEHMQPNYMPQPTTEQWASIAYGFEEKWQFPHCVGALAGKHILIKKPGKSGKCFNKHTFSIVLMALVDSDYQFITIDVDSMERFSDKNAFDNSVLAKKMKNKTLNLPPPSRIPTIDDPIPYVFAGDEAFPLSENLMRPYPRRSVADNYENKVFNYRLSRARQTVECSFNILASRFCVFRSPFECKVSTVVKIVKASCILHNYLRNSAILQTEGDISEQEFLQYQLRPLHHTNVRSGCQAFFIRQKFTEYFNSPGGSVSWQRDCVLKGKY